jgi:enamine deaminase RidA (YjgF/YER057c/UK114 family)
LYLNPFAMRPVFVGCLLLVCFQCFSQTPEAKLARLGIQLPTIPSPIASYVHYVKTGNLIFLAGKGPQRKEGDYIKGKLGAGLTTEQGYEAARLTGVIQLAVLKEALGDLSKVKRIVKVTGFVNSDGAYTDHPKVINGFSDLMIAVFGDRGRHARTALGVAALPMNMAVEVEMVVEVEE